MKKLKLNLKNIGGSVDSYTATIGRNKLSITHPINKFGITRNTTCGIIAQMDVDVSETESIRYRAEHCVDVKRAVEKLNNYATAHTDYDVEVVV